MTARPADRDPKSERNVLLQLLHQPPFRLLDRVLRADLSQGRLVALRRLSVNDALWPAESAIFHSKAAAFRFPEVFVIEALCQAAACVNTLEQAGSGDEPPSSHLGYLVSIADFRFHAPEENFATLGDTLLLEVERAGPKMGAIVAFTAKAQIVSGASGASDRAAENEAFRTSEAETGRPAKTLASGRLLFAVNPK